MIAVEKITNKPIVAVFNTHVHGDHWLTLAFTRFGLLNHIGMGVNFDRWIALNNCLIAEPVVAKKLNEWNMVYHISKRLYIIM
jgi:glyoxylase-like metal-dependent hydrolase (beta-lactamase superfamily II)